MTADDRDAPHARHFLGPPPATPAAERLRQDDVDEVGYVMNVSWLWSHLPEGQEGLFELLGRCARQAGLDLRTRGVLVAATASALGDAYCSLAWGGKLASAADPGLAAAVLRGDDDALTPTERALARWARQVTRDPNGTTATDVEALREVGLDDAQIVAVTLFVALRLAFSTVNDALGAVPDAELRTTAPSAVVDAVTWGRR